MTLIRYIQRLTMTLRSFFVPSFVSSDLVVSQESKECSLAATTEQNVGYASVLIEDGEGNTRREVELVEDDDDVEEVKGDDKHECVNVVKCSMKDTLLSAIEEEMDGVSERREQDDENRKDEDDSKVETEQKEMGAGETEQRDQSGKEEIEEEQVQQ